MRSVFSGPIRVIIAAIPLIMMIAVLWGVIYTFTVSFLQNSGLTGAGAWMASVPFESRQHAVFPGPAMARVSPPWTYGRKAED